jgi:aryl-alcohol dehydrogenase-like predicted oxidoreductase
MWGWTTSKETAFALLDEWYSQGFREVDAATNYPIDKNPEHFRLSEKILLEWIAAHRVTDLKVMMKIGSVNNLRTPEHVLTKSFVLMMLDEYAWLFGSNLDTLMVHWDNRNERPTIRETLDALNTARQHKLRVGLSGIQHPGIYAELNKEFSFDFRIQIKHNLLHSDYDRYTAFHGKPRFIAYGINAGGLKSDPASYTDRSSFTARGGDVSATLPVLEKVQTVFATANRQTHRPALTAFHQAGMIYAFYHPDMQGILLGSSSVTQLKDSISFFKRLQGGEYGEVFEKLKTV